MNLDLINRGVSPNDGTGDTLRDGAGKINDNFLKLLAAHASQTGNPAGGLNLNDVLPGFRPDNPSDRAEGGLDFGITAQALLAFIASNMSASQLNQLLRLQFACRVNPSAAISNISGRVAIIAARLATGVYEFTNAESRVFNTLVVTNRQDSPGQSHVVKGLGTDTVTVEWYNSASALANTEFAIMGQLD